MKKYIPIFISEILADESIPFNIYCQAGDQKEPILFMRSGSKIKKDRLRVFAANESLQFFLDPSDINTYKEFFASKSKKKAPKLEPALVKAAVDHALELEKTEKKKPRVRCLSLKNVFLGSAALAGLEMYFSVGESLAAALGGIAAMGLLAACLALTEFKPTANGDSEKNEENDKPAVKEKGVSPAPSPRGSEASPPEPSPAAS